MDVSHSVLLFFTGSFVAPFYRMSPDSDPPQENGTPGSARRESGTSGSNMVAFVDSQDPNARSAIQRHTAYHSAAQRRYLRSRLLRRSSSFRLFEWSRRPSQDARTSSTSSTPTSTSIRRAQSLPGRPAHSRTSRTQEDGDLVVFASQTAQGPVPETAATTAVNVVADDSILYL